MGRQKDKLRSIRDRSPSPDRTYREKAEALIRNYKPLKNEKRGRPSEVSLIFDLCVWVSLDLISNANYAQFSEHVDHTPKPQEDVDDGGDFLLSIDSCKCCEKLDLYTPLSRYRLTEEIRNLLEKCGNMNELDGILNDSKSKKTSIISDRALIRHLKAWLTIMHHPEWLTDGIPLDHEGLFENCQIEYFDDYRKSIQSHTQASDAWQLSYTIQEFFNTPLLVD